MWERTLTSSGKRLRSTSPCDCTFQEVAEGAGVADSVGAVPSPGVPGVPAVPATFGR